MEKNESSHPRGLFSALYNAETEEELEVVIGENGRIFADANNWKPLGGDESNFSTVKNQQSNPIAALVEKITNSIDAILTKKCFESNLDPKGSDAPKSMEEAMDMFFPEHRSWNQLPTFRRKQAEEIQIFPSGPRKDRSVIIYDNGEGQHPEHFESTFLSLRKSNKNKILFVQGKYNMGGTGAIVFCGRKRYQLIASKKYDNSGMFGFTLIREHYLEEADSVKETWFEYLTIEGKIPSFPIDQLDLGLKNRKFITGSIIKMYSYQFPWSSSAFTQNLAQSINEYLFEPSLPIYTKDFKAIYPEDKVLELSIFGLSRRLLAEEKDYLEDKFSINVDNHVRMGDFKITCFLFKRKVKQFSAADTKKQIARRYFKNKMSVIFTMNGQVHGRFTSEFITNSLKLNLLKNYLLVHVECTKMKYQFRKELFMASRDRLREGGEHAQFLRKFLASTLTKPGGRLKEKERLRKQAVNIDSSLDTKDLIKSLSKGIPLNSEMMKLLNQTFKLDQVKTNDSKSQRPKQVRKKNQKEEFKFNPKRFPSFLRLDKKIDGEIKTIQIPRGGEKRIIMLTDVENEYFDRLEEPGELKITILGAEDELELGNDKRNRKKPSKKTEILNVIKSSPENGKIKISIGVPNEMSIGERREVHVSLTGPEGPFEEIFFVKIAKKKSVKKKKDGKEDRPDVLGLPDLVLAYEKKSTESSDASWDQVNEATAQDMSYEDVICLQVAGDTLEKIFINMESRVLMNFRSKQRNQNEEQIQITNKKYYTSMYFHVLFLYTITLNRKFKICREDGENVDIGKYLKDVFGNFYATFILSYGSDVLLESIAE